MSVPYTIQSCRNPHHLISLLFLFFLFLAARSHGTPLENRRSGRSSSLSVFSLFNLKEKSRFWSEAVLRGGGGGDFSDLESSSHGKAGSVNYTKAGIVCRPAVQSADRQCIGGRQPHKQPTNILHGRWPFHPADGVKQCAYKVSWDFGSLWRGRTVKTEAAVVWYGLSGQDGSSMHHSRIPRQG